MEQKKYDIIVVGGGFAGTASAITAARQGKKVLLIEKYNCLGGVACFNLVNPFMPYHTKDPQTKENIALSRGLFSEIMEKLDAAGGLRVDKHCFSKEILKYVLLKMALESNVELLFQSYVTKADCEDNAVKSVTVANVSGEQTLYADYFIDATGDANVAYLAGFPYRLGRDSDHLCQPMTLCFRLGNVNANIGQHDSFKGMHFKSRVNELYKEFQKQGKIKNPREDVLVFRTITDNIYHFNTTRVIKLNPTDVWDVTKAEIEAREQVFEMYNFLRENFKEFKDSVLLETGLQIGVRESRMIEGEHTLTQEEVLACTNFEDSIAVCNYDIDIHSPDGTGTSHFYFAPGKYYTIPYGCLIPKNSKNLLVAGRCVSATHEAQASLRIMPTCCTLGEAAGVAIAVAHTECIGVKETNIGTIRQILKENGAKID